MCLHPFFSNATPTTPPPQAREFVLDYKLVLMNKQEEVQVRDSAGRGGGYSSCMAQ